LRGYGNIFACVGALRTASLFPGIVGGSTPSFWKSSYARLKAPLLPAVKGCEEEVWTLQARFFTVRSGLVWSRLVGGSYCGGLCITVFREVTHRAFPSWAAPERPRIKSISFNERVFLFGKPENRKPYRALFTCLLHSLSLFGYSFSMLDLWRDHGFLAAELFHPILLFHSRWRCWATQKLNGSVLGCLLRDRECLSRFHGVGCTGEDCQMFRRKKYPLRHLPFLHMVDLPLLFCCQSSRA